MKTKRIIQTLLGITLLVNINIQSMKQDRPLPLETRYKNMPADLQRVTLNFLISEDPEKNIALIISLGKTAQDWLKNYLAKHPELQNKLVTVYKNEFSKENPNADVIALLDNAGIKLAHESWEAWAVKQVGNISNYSKINNYLGPLDRGYKFDQIVSPLYLAAALCKTELFKALLDKQYDPNLKSGKPTQSPLDVAIIVNCNDIVKILLMQKLTQEIKDNALLYTVQENNPQALELLLQNKANPTIKDKTGNSVIDYAKMYAKMLNKAEPLKILNKFGYQ